MVRVYHVKPKSRGSFFPSMSVNTILILINVVAFILALIFGFFPSSPDQTCEDTICKFISLQPANVLQGKYIWSFLTSVFMHGGFPHLFVNMLTLLFVGSLVERLLGSRRYLLFYLVSGLFAGIFFVASAFVFPSDFNSYAVGASGAIFGLLGLLMLLTPNLKVLIMFIIPLKMKYAVPGILIVLWLISIAGGLPIGNMAHLGGFVLGVAYGLYLRKKYKNKTRQISQYFS